MRTVIVGRSSSGIPGPLVHRDEMDVGLAFDQRLGSVAVMDVPINYQDSVQPMFLARVMGGDGDIPEETESHRAVVDGVVSGRSNCAETARMHAGDRQIYGRQNASDSCRRRIPGTAARHRVGVEPTSSLLGDHPHRRDIGRIVPERDLFSRCMPTFKVFDRMEKIWTLA